MQPDDPRHGTYAGAQAHLLADGEVGCERCLAAYRRYQNRAAKERALGYGPRRVPSAEVTRHLRALVAGGMSVLDIAARAGVSHSTVTDLKNRPRKLVLRSTRDALLGVELVLTAEARVCGVGTLRRIRALARLGWSYSAISQAARDAGHDIPGYALDQIIWKSTGTVEVKTREAVAAAFDALSMTLPPPSRGASCVRTRAARKGWPPPLAWGEDIDDPTAQPTGIRYEWDTYRERVAIGQHKGHAPVRECPRCGVPRAVKLVTDNSVCEDCKPMERAS